jgi:soluble lytic murein transglycosylase-like protein
MTQLSHTRNRNSRAVGWQTSIQIFAVLIALCCIPYGRAVAQSPACDACTAISQPQPLSGESLALSDAGSRNAEKAAIARHLVSRFRLKPKLAERIVDAVYREAESRGLSPSLVLAVIAAESSFDPTATSPVGARGLMQVLPRYHRTLVSHLAHGADLYFPENNIRIGTAILQRYLAVTAGDIDAALTSYSGGSPGYTGRVYTKWQEFSGFNRMPAPERLTLLMSQSR